MRLTNRATVVVNLTDATTLRGTVARSWRWRVVRLNAVATGGLDQELKGYVLIPHRAILSVQVVS